MSADELFALIFIATAVFGVLICTAIDMGLFDMIAVKICDYIVSRMERIEGKDI